VYSSFNPGVRGLTFVSFKNDGDLSFILVVFQIKVKKQASSLFLEDWRITTNSSHGFFLQKKKLIFNFFNPKYLEKILLTLANIFMALNNPTYN